MLSTKYRLRTFSRSSRSLMALKHFLYIGFCFFNIFLFILLSSFSVHILNRMQTLILLHLYTLHTTHNTNTILVKGKGKASLVPKGSKQQCTRTK